MKYTILVILCALFFTACRDHVRKRLYVSLQYSGENRMELEKVLAHYSVLPGDSLKLEAAKFLIENMPGHYTYSSDFLDEYYEKLDSATNLYEYERKLFQTIPFNRPEYRKDFQVKEDIKQIRAEFLIHQIELAFWQWESIPWAQGLNFEEFKEYLLPYRVANEPLDYWRDSSNSFPVKVNDYIELYDDCRYRTSQLGTLYFGYIANHQEKIPLKVLQDFEMDCIPTSLAQLIAFRMIGIPGAIDFVPHYGNRNGRHYWTTVIDPKVKTQQIFHGESYRMPKVYRRTYSHNPVVIPEKDEYVPPFFMDPFNRDVSALYFPAQELKIEIPQEIKARYVYLTVFNEQAWQPVTWARISRNKACFKNIGRGLIYLPVYYDKEGVMHPVSAPVAVLENGKMKYLQPGEGEVPMRLARKYPNNSDHDYWYDSFVGACFEAADDCQFEKAKIVYRIETLVKPQYLYVYPDTNLHKRYWRFRLKEDVRGADMADLRFYDCSGNELKGVAMNIKHTEYEKITDDSPLTYGFVNKWVGVDFGESVKVSKIRYMCRNDANGICPGHEYELLYYQYPEGWISAGIKHPEENELTYDHVPTGAVYWLRNLTEGKEERIFTYENNKVVFW